MRLMRIYPSLAVNVRDLNLCITSRYGCINRRNHGWNCSLDAWPARGEQNNDAYSSSRKVLLVLQTLVRTHQDLISITFSGIQQVAIP